MDDIDYSMGIVNTAHERRGLRATLSSIVAVLFVASFAACLVSDVTSCCDGTEHEGEDICACACVFDGTAVFCDVTPPTFVVTSDLRIEPPLHSESATSPPLYRPPRSLPG